MNFLKPDRFAEAVESDPTVQIIDIRDDEVYGAFRLPYENVLHIPLAYLESRIAEISKDWKVLIVCHQGKQSITAFPYLTMRGYDVLGCLEGGVMGWQKAGKPVDR